MQRLAMIELILITDSRYNTVHIHDKDVRGYLQRLAGLFPDVGREAVLSDLRKRLESFCKTSTQAAYMFDHAA